MSDNWKFSRVAKYSPRQSDYDRSSGLRSSWRTDWSLTGGSRSSTRLWRPEPSVLDTASPEQLVQLTLALRGEILSLKIFVSVALNIHCRAGRQRSFKIYKSRTSLSEKRTSSGVSGRDGADMIRGSRDSLYLTYPEILQSEDEEFSPGHLLLLQFSQLREPLIKHTVLSLCFSGLGILETKENQQIRKF